MAGGGWGIEGKTRAKCCYFALGTSLALCQCAPRVSNDRHAELMGEVCCSPMSQRRDMGHPILTTQTRATRHSEGKVS
jgi:hypothetical protein